MRYSKKKAVSWIGRLLVLGSFVFIAVKIRQYDVDFSVLTSLSVTAGLLLAALVFGVSIFLTAFNFRWLLRVLSGVSVERGIAVTVYCGSNLYKYLPGNVMHFIGRNRLAIETEELSHAQVAVATVMDNLFLCLAAVIISSLCAFDYFISFMRNINVSHLVLTAAGVIASICVLLAVFFRRGMTTSLKKFFTIMENFRLAAMLRFLGVAIMRLMVLAVTYFATLVLLGQQVTPDTAPKIIGLFVLSWVAGFIMPGAPGGLGIREAILLMFMGDTLNESILLSSTIIHRVVCVLGDLSAYGIALLYSKLKPT